MNSANVGGLVIASLAITLITAARREIISILVWNPSGFSFKWQRSFKIIFGI
jgi:hypothetical protein